MAQPTAQDVHIDAALSQISIAYRNQKYIAGSLFPVVTVPKQSDKYYIWTKDHWFRNYVQVRTPGDSYPEGGLELSSTSFFCDIFHLAYPLPDEVLKNQDAAIDLAAAGAEWLADQFLLNQEAAFVADFFKTGVWGTDKTLSGTAQWSDFDGSDPIGDIDLAKDTVHKATGVEPNLLVVGREVWNKLKEHPLLLDKFKYTSVAILSDAQIADALGIKVVVGQMVENTAQEGATFSGAYTWGKNALAIYVPARPGLMTPAAGYTFVWNINGGDLPVQISRIREDSRDRDLLKGKHAFDQKAVGTDLGYFIASAVA